MTVTWWLHGGDTAIGVQAGGGCAAMTWRLQGGFMLVGVQAERGWARAAGWFVGEVASSLGGGRGLVSGAPPAPRSVDARLSMRIDAIRRARSSL